ncbi:MAG TPA: hypothetical protein VNX01_04500 [Bacteroidia bacterium]|jgi:hypothetical protein|nr:hypothetical protein [Bacteroidia bacterium]
MKKNIFINGLFFIAFVFGACNQNKNDSDTDSTLSSEGLNKPYVKNVKNDSTMHNDTIITPPEDNNLDKK